MDKKAFDGKVAIVTGAGQGIGFEIVRQLAGQGAAVILNDIDEALAQKATELMGRPATPADVANAVLFFVADRARHITGQNLVIDGGWTAISPSPY